MDESRSSNRSEQCQTPSSSGYESAADPRRRLGNNSNATTTGSNSKQQQQQQQQQHESAAVHNHRHQRQHLVDELSPASDYRRQFVLGPRTLDRSSPGRKMTTTPDVAAAAADGLIPSQQRIGKANLLHQNSFYVTRIHMPSAVGDGTTSTDRKTTTTRHAVMHDEWEKYEQQSEDQGNCFNSQKKKIPHPVWPTTTGNKQQRTTNSSAIVQQNENYVTKILIAPKMFEMNKQQDEEETMDSIVTHSLLVMTSYDDQQSIEDDDLKKETKMEMSSVSSGPGPAGLSEIRQLSQTLSQSRVVATVSRALSKSSAGSSSSSETAYPTTPTTNAESSSSSSSSSSSTVAGGSIARRISMMKERWDKSSRRRLLTESDDDDPCAVMTIGNRRLDHVYVPQNGDVNFSIGQLNPRYNNHSASGEPFSYLAGIYHPATITEEVTVNESQVCAVIVPSSNNRMSNHCDPFEQDRLSNSSSRSSGSRRVTFSADTVDNEHSTKSSTTNSISSSRSSDKNSLSNSVNIIEELKLNPHYLPHRYQQPQPSVNSSVVDVVGTSSSRLAGYYSYNLQAQLDNYKYIIIATIDCRIDCRLDIPCMSLYISFIDVVFCSYYISAKGHGEKVSTWEHYHHQQDAISSKGATTSRPGSSSAGVVRLDPYNNLQLHPNYVAACQVSQIQSRLCCLFLFGFCFFMDAKKRARHLRPSAQTFRV